MKCDAVRDQLALMALGEPVTLPPPVVRHLTSCNGCRQAYQEYLSVAQRLASVTAAVEPPPHLKADVLDHIQRTGKTASGGRESRKGVGLLGSWARSLTHATGVRGWAAAALLLGAVNVGLVWHTASIQDRLIQVEERLATSRREVMETWRAFASAPATLAGHFAFVDQDTHQQIKAQGLLYKRPGGWAALIRVDGLKPTDEGEYRAWFQDEQAWTDGGTLFVDEEGVGTLIYYAREDDVGLKSVWIVRNGANPGDATWKRETVLTGEAVLTQGDTHRSIENIREVW